jgi:acyl carrier protein
MGDVIDAEKLLIQFVKENTFKDTDLLTDTTLLFQEGLFDSMGFALLIDFIEEKFGIQTEDEDMVEENFESINAIVDYIQRKKN